MKFSIYAIRRALTYRNIRYNFKRIFIWAPQRAKHGWASNDTWNLNDHLTDIILGSLKYFSKNLNGHPARLNSLEEWRKELDEVITAFQDYHDYDDRSVDRYDEMQRKHGIKDTLATLTALSKAEFNDQIATEKRKKISSKELKKFYQKEEKIYKDIQERMKKLIDVWPNLWN